MGHNLNVNETTDAGDEDVEAHDGTVQSNETVVEDDDVEAHGGGIQSNETVVEDADEEKLADLDVPAEQADAVKGGMNEMGEMESL